jgi:dCMP deaminase
VQKKWIDAYLDMADRFAQLSYAKRLKVGAIVVKDNRVISIGYNGTPAGWDNDCEELVYRIAEEPVLKTKAEVIHAEANAIIKLAKSGDSSDGGSMFITHAPCVDCAKLIFGSGINSVYYRNSYRSEEGIEFLKKCNIVVEKVLD